MGEKKHLGGKATLETDAPLVLYPRQKGRVEEKESETASMRGCKNDASCVEAEYVKRGSLESRTEVDREDY